MSEDRKENRPNVLGMVFRWSCAAILLVGPFLPWSHTGFDNSAAASFYEFFFSRVSQPNPEWLLWFLAPMVSGLICVSGLIRQRRVPISAGVLGVVFLIAWAALFPTGVRAYMGLLYFLKIGLSAVGFPLTFAAVLGSILFVAMDFVSKTR